MECYDTCADIGKRCLMPRERICCPDCGKINPCYNISSDPCDGYYAKETQNKTTKKDKERGRPNEVCKCKQSCWQWILSFLGLGGKLPDCCKNVHLTAWDSGEVARGALVSKVHDVVSLVSGRDQPAEQTQISKPPEKPETREEKKVANSGGSSDKDALPQESSEDSNDQMSAKEQGQGAADKKKKSLKTRSSSLQRGRPKQRKSAPSKSRSTSRSDKQQTRKSASKTRSRSSSSTSVSQGEKKRKKTRSRSRSSTKIFNPFKGRQPSSQCNMRSPYCPALPCTPCPGTQPKSFLSRLTEDQISTFPEKCSSPFHQPSPSCPPTQPSQIRRSNSMSYRPVDSCLKTEAPACQCHSDVGPKLPFRSQSFDCAPMRFTSPRACCLSGHTTCPRSGTWTSCSSSMKSNANMKPYIRGSGVGRMSPSFCQSINRPATGLCPGTCTKPSCLPYMKALDTRQFTSPPSSIANVSCCTALNILKARHSDALCNQLLSRYGYSPPSSRLCPLTCYECGCSTSCLKYGRFPGMGGCITCRPMADHTSCTMCCVHCENYTNSRKPRSPECHVMDNQLIEFNHSPCEKQPLCEFQLPPHCIRETGPRSPVDEYMAIIRVPKPAKKQEQQEEVVVEQPKEAEAAPKKEQAEEAKPPRKKVKRLSRKGTGKAQQARNVNENAKSECPSTETSGRLQLFVADQDPLCNKSVLIIPHDISNCWLLHCEQSFNNNYGGESYRISRYSSAGPVQIDFSELNARNNRYSNMPTHSSASSGFVARYSRPNYQTPTSSSDVRVINSFVSQMYNRDTRDFLDSCHFGDRWYRPRTLSNASINSHKLSENRPLTFNRSTNSAGLETPDILNSSKYNVRLETAIENKIRELRNLKVFRSPPARKKLYSNSLFEQMTKVRENPNVPIKRNVPQEEFIRDSLDQITHRAQRRKHEFKHSDNYLNVTLPKDTLSSELATQEDTSYQHRTGDSSNKPVTVLPSQNTTTQPRETAPDIEASRNMHEMHYNRNASPGIKKEMLGDFTMEHQQSPTQVCLETAKDEDINPSSVLDYEPVFKSLIEQFEETVQVYALSKEEPDLSDQTFETTDTQQSLFNVFTEESMDMARNMNAQAVEWNEENQSSNKVDKSLGSIRTMVAESSPPHKPIMVTSSEAQNSSVSTCSCRSNSPGTSSVSLEIGRLGRFAHSNQSVSESASCVDTSITFTKVTDIPRPTEETPIAYSRNVVSQSMSASTVVSNTFNKLYQHEDSRVSSKTPHSQFKMAFEQVNMLSTEKQVLASGGDSGSSVDPIVSKYANKLANIIGNSSVDESNEYYFSKDVLTAQMDAISKPEAGDTTTCSSSTNVDLLPPQKPPVPAKSLTELMREFIRRNGTPV